MRITSILLALPLLGSVFAVPAPNAAKAELGTQSYSDIVKKGCTTCSGTSGGTNGGGINGVDGVIAIFADIKTQLASNVPYLFPTIPPTYQYHPSSLVNPLAHPCPST